MHKTTRAAALAAMCAAVVAAGAVTGGAAAFGASPTTTATALQAPVPSGQDVVQRMIPFDHAISLTDAARIAAATPNAIAVNFSAGSVEGQWATQGSISVSDFLSRTASVYGAVPQATSLVVTDAASTLAQHEQAQHPIITDKPTFAGEAATKVPSRSTSELKSGGTATHSNANMAHPDTTNPSALNWAPEDAYINVTRDGSSLIDFNETYQWDGAGNNGNDPRYTNSDFGLEFGLDAYTNNLTYSGGTRSACAAGYKDQPWAKDYGWTYTVQTVVPGGEDVEPAPANVKSYADYNDLGDACNRNSVAIGLEYPQNIPIADDGWSALIVDVLAPRGVDSSGLMGGSVQAVDNRFCIGNPGMALTDCMGVDQEGYPTGNGNRLTLNTSHGWNGPNTCWYSGETGAASPELEEC